MYMVACAVYVVLDIISYLILARAVLSFFPILHNKFTELLAILTEPVLAPVRMLLDRVAGKYMTGIDFSPFVALLVIKFLQSMLVV